MRFVKILVSVLLCCVLLMACSTAEEESFSGSLLGNGVDSYDLNGLVIKYGVALDSGNGVDPTNNILGYSENTVFAELAENRINQVEKDLNCEFDIFYDATADMVKLNAASGSRYCDVFLGASFNAPSWAKAGLMTGIASELNEYIDYTDAEKWGSANKLQPMLYIDDLYGLTPAAWPEQNYSSFGYLMIANMDLIHQNGAGDPREMIENGKWNWDAFEKELVLNTVTEGDETTTYGMVTSYPYFAEMICFSNGSFSAIIKEDGSYACGFYEQAGRTALEEVDKIWRGELNYTISPEETYLSEVVAQNFTEYEMGSYSFLPTQFVFGVFGMVCEYLDNFAVLTTPVGPDVNSDYVSAIYHAQNYTIYFPLSAANIDAAATAIDNLYEPFEEYSTYDDVKEYMNRNYFFDDRDGENFFKLYDSAKWNFDYCTMSTSFPGREIPCQVCTTKLSVSEILDKYSDFMDEFLAEVVTPSYDAQKLLFN